MIFALALSACGDRSPVPAFDPIPAFPGAEGFGAFTRGGRGGKTIIVTNLDDRGAGSFRAALSTKGARTIVFETSGTIDLRSPLEVIEPYVTIAGQTAPGGGICLRRHGLSIRCAEVIVQHLRLRPGAETGIAADGLSIYQSRNVIIDHCSVSWGVDECLSAYSNRDITVQWCLIAEGLYDSVHPKGPHSMGGIWGGPSGSFHHNLFAHHDLRTPRLTGKTGVADIRNNVSYNRGQRSAYGGTDGQFNFVANVFKPGPATAERARRMLLDGGAGDGARIFLADNILLGSDEVSADNWIGYTERKGTRDEILMPTPFDAPPVKTDPPNELYERVLAGVGATLPTRDSADTRIIKEARTGTATFGASYGGGGKGIIDSPNDVGGWPELYYGTPPTDSDRDGMPDAYEKAQTLDPNDPADARSDSDGDGYSELEEYLHSLTVISGA